MNTHSGYPSIDKPWLKYYQDIWTPEKLPKKTVYRNIYDNNQNNLNDTAIIFQNKNISFKEMFSNVDMYAKALKSNGIETGDCVNFCVSYTPETVYLLLACSEIGALANYINPLFTSEQKLAIIKDTNAKILFILDAMLPYMENVLPEINTSKIVIIPFAYSLSWVTQKIVALKLNSDSSLKKINIINKQILTWDKFLEQHAQYHHTTEFSYVKNTPAVMVYSSGTTGASKGIVLTNDGINSTISHYQSTDFPYSRRDTFLCMVPIWFSTGNVLSLLMPLCLGISTILEPVFSKESFLKDVIKYKPNMTLAATDLWLYLIKSKKCQNLDFSFFKYPITGGEKILHDVEIEINNFFVTHNCTVPLFKGYGMCELGSTVTSDSPNHTKAGSVGYPIKGVSVSAFDTDTNEELTYGVRGEIRVNSHSHMKEYYNNPTATANFFYNDNYNNQWGCTGDIGYVDKDGYIFILGRVTDCFTSMTNQKVFLFDIENVILKDNAIADCKAVYTKNNKIIAHLKLKEPDAENDSKLLDRIHELCKCNLKSNELPTHYKIRSSFPVHANGKRDIEALKSDTYNIIASNK